MTGASLWLGPGNHQPLTQPMVETATRKVAQLIKSLPQEGHIDEMTAKWLSLMPNPPRIPIFYTLTKIHKPTPVGTPIISGCDGPTERISAFVDRLIQPIAQKQDSYLKDTTDFLNFIESTKLPKNTVLVSMDVTSLYTNIPHEEGVTTVCHAYEDFYGDKAPIPTKYLREILYLILTENSFLFCGSNYLQTHGTAMGTKMAVAFANIFMARIERQILSQSCIKPLFWKRYIDDVFSLWNTSLDKIESFVKKANNFHSTIKFTAEMSQTEITFLDTKVYKGVRFDKTMAVTTINADSLLETSEAENVNMSDILNPTDEENLPASWKTHCGAVDHELKMDQRRSWMNECFPPPSTVITLEPIRADPILITTIIIQYSSQTYFEFHSYGTITLL